MLHLSARGPLDFAFSCHRYHVWGQDSANWYRDGRFRRIIEVAGRHWLYEVSGAGIDAVQVRLLASWEIKDADRGVADECPSEAPALLPSVRCPRPPGLEHGGSNVLFTAVRDEVVRLFSLDDELEAFYRMAAERDPTLHRLCGRLRGYRVTRAATLFEALVTAISAQQIHLEFAFTVRNRLIRAFSRPLAFAGETHYPFPLPAAVARARVEVLRAMQFSTRKAQYLIGAARALAEGEIDPEELKSLPNEEVVARLCCLPGIGRWTAEWALIRAFGRDDVIPADDLGVQQAVGRFYFDGRRPTASEVRALAEQWSPWETYATYYLLAGLRLGAA